VTHHFRHPAVVLAGLAIVSGALGNYVQGGNYTLSASPDTAPSLGLHMVLTGAWFALVAAAGVWWRGRRSPAAPVSAFLGAWIGWQLAVNLALLIDARWPASMPAALAGYAGGFAAGAVGALATWAGAAFAAPGLRRTGMPLAFATTGAALGLLLPLTNTFDTGLVLLLPWQVAIAALLGHGLDTRPLADRQVGAARDADTHPRSSLRTATA